MNKKTEDAIKKIINDGSSIISKDDAIVMLKLELNKSVNDIDIKNIDRLLDELEH